MQVQVSSATVTAAPLRAAVITHRGSGTKGALGRRQRRAQPWCRRSGKSSVAAPAAAGGQPANEPLGGSSAATAEGPIGGPSAVNGEASKLTGRKFVYAVDGKPSSELALQWAVANIFSKGDTVYLAHCLNDPRTPATAVGSSPAATQWSPARDEQRYAKEFFLRMEHESSAMLQGRYVPVLQFKGIAHKELLLRLKVHSSAAGIAEAICSKAADLQADAVMIASHGAGVLADYGSVARWAAENSKVPALLLPPSTTEPQSIAQPTSRTLVVAAADNLEGLRDAFEWALQKMAKPGDEVYVLHAEQLVGDEAAMEARKRLVQATYEWQQSSGAPVAPSVNVVCDIVQGTSAPDESMADPEGESGTGAQICELAAAMNARCVVLHHHGAGMMRELLWGHVTMHAKKFCSRALVVLEPRHMRKA